MIKKKMFIRFVLLIFCLNRLDCLIYLFDENEIDRKECFVELDLENGRNRCWNNRCDQHRDPLRIRHSFYFDEPENDEICFFNYLKLSFSSYDHFLLFIENQRNFGFFLENFFSKPNENDRQRRKTMLHVS